mgnify:CR=1 FL=1
MFQGGLVPAGSAMAYLNSSGQVWVPPLDRFDQFFMGKGLFRPRTPLAAFSWSRRPLALPWRRNCAYAANLERLPAMENYKLMNLVLIYFSIAKVNF